MNLKRPLVLFLVAAHAGAAMAKEAEEMKIFNDDRIGVGMTRYPSYPLENFAYEVSASAGFWKYFAVDGAVGNFYYSYDLPDGKKGTDDVSNTVLGARAYPLTFERWRLGAGYFVQTMSGNREYTTTNRAGEQFYITGRFKVAYADLDIAWTPALVSTFSYSDVDSRYGSDFRGRAISLAYKLERRVGVAAGVATRGDNLAEDRSVNLGVNVYF